MSNTMILRIDREAVSRMKSHAESAYPEECCGFLYGSSGQSRRVILARAARNASEQNRGRRFRIDPLEYREAEEYADRNRLDLLGIYHSHPDHAAEPSEHDRDVAMPWFSYMILSVRERGVVECRSWRLNEQRNFEEEALNVKESLITE